jgi:dihydroorotase
LTLELVHQGVLSKERAVELLTIGPAKSFGLAGGHLAAGAPASVTIVDPEARWTVDANRFFSKSRNTPFHGRSVRGRVVCTIVHGRVVFEEGRIMEMVV